VSRCLCYQSCYIAQYISDDTRLNDSGFVRETRMLD
jgi:hypothetical protein